MWFQTQIRQEAISEINPDNFLDINIILPGLAEQKRIGKLLSDIDHKIELNRAINQNLRASRAQIQTQFELCRGVTVNARLRAKDGRMAFSQSTLVRSSEAVEVHHAA